MIVHHGHDCSDWEVKSLDDRLEFRPSIETFVNRAKLTFWVAVLLGVILFLVGLRPGGSGEQFQYERAQQRLKRQHQDLANLNAAINALDSSDPQFQQRLQQSNQRNNERLRTREEFLDENPPANYTTLDLLYWGLLGSAMLAAVIYPISGAWQRLTIQKSGNNLRVIRRGLVPSVQQFSISRLARIQILVQRKILRERQTNKIHDLGWLWRVLLCDAQGGVMAEIWPDLEPFLPSKVHRLTGKTRTLVSFLQAASGVQADPPVEEDVVNVQETSGGYLTHRRLRRHAAPAVPPYQPRDTAD